MIWEYTTRFASLQLSTDEMNKMGAEGWELCGIVNLPHGNQFNFKRQKPPFYP